MRSGKRMASFFSVSATMAVAIVSLVTGTAYVRTGALVESAARGQSIETGALDRLLDLYVRDGLVYYAALRSDRAGLDRFVGSLTTEPVGFDTRPINDRKAFWLNAYNALVLETVIDHYPIRGQTAEYPTNSIRQIPGAFDRQTHRVAGRDLTLDAIETTVITELSDPRLFLALGRGAVDSGRLRSETYVSSRLEEQLEEVLEEFATSARHVNLDRLAQEVRVSPIFGWRQDEFVATYAEQGWVDSGRTPLERAVLTAIEPKLFPSERAFLEENQFTLQYHSFDWRLNDLTGGRP